MDVLRLVPASGRPIEVSKDAAVVGRDEVCDIVLNDGSVSRRHARIERRGLSWAVVDNNSANGTFLNSHRVVETEVLAGQELRFGSVSFHLEVGPPSTASTPATGISTSPPPPPVLSPPAAAIHIPRGPVPSLAAPPGAGPRPGRGPFFWMGAGCAGCLVMIGLVIALAGGAAFFFTGAPVNAFRSLLAEIKAGRWDAAYAGLSTTLKGRMTVTDLRALAAAHPAFGDNEDTTFWERSIDNRRARMSGVLTSRSGAREGVTVELIREEGQWRVSDIQFGSAGPPPRSP